MILHIRNMLPSILMHGLSPLGPKIVALAYVQGGHIAATLFVATDLAVASLPALIFSVNSYKNAPKKIEKKKKTP